MESRAWAWTNTELHRLLNTPPDFFHNRQLQTDNSKVGYGVREGYLQHMHSHWEDWTTTYPNFYLKGHEHEKKTPPLKTWSR